MGDRRSAEHGAGSRSGRRIEWPTVVLVVGCYGVWAGAGLWLWPAYPLLALAVIALTVAMQSSLMHEALHGHPTRDARVNEVLVGLPIGLVYPYRRFKALHLRHHADERLTDPFDDPESNYKALWKHERLPEWLKLLLKVNNTLAGRFVIGPVLANAAFVMQEWALLKADERGVRRAWLHHAVGLAIVLPVVQFGFDMPLWLYLLVPTWLGQSFIAIRTFAEHQWSERPDGRTVIVERSPLAFLFLNNNLHLVHHKAPTVAWYDLPNLYRERRDEWRRMNGGYVFRNYGELFRAFAWKAKDPVVHPHLRRAPEPGRAFRPRMRANNVNGLGTIAVPAEPPKE